VRACVCVRACVRCMHVYMYVSIYAVVDPRIQMHDVVRTFVTRKVNSWVLYIRPIFIILYWMYVH